MGKGTDKLYITHSEWASEDAFSANVGVGAAKASGRTNGASFKRLPFNFCAVSLQPFKHPVCTHDGTIFDVEHIASWLKTHKTNPVDGQPLKSADLIKLNFNKNDEGEYVDPVTFKPFTNNTHLVALRNTGNVFAWDTIERLNIKAKNWRDLVSDDEFSRKDIITLQDPQNLGSRDLSSFKYIKEGTSTLSDKEKQERADPLNNVNLSAMGNAARVLRAKEAVAKAREERAVTNDPNRTGAAAVRKANGSGQMAATAHGAARSNAALATAKPVPYNAAKHTTGKAAASFTSTGLTPHTSNERALLTEEEFMLKPRRVKQKGYARIETSLGPVSVELQTEFAPKAVWNFVQLAKKGYYRQVAFHRNIKNFMIQGGDPTGTGRGGSSVWGKPFEDEFGQSPLKHDARGTLSMANKGKNTNTSQFFITYRPAPHLDRKHTIFGRIVDGQASTTGESERTLAKLEAAQTENDKPVDELLIEDVVVYVDPFEEFQKQKRVAEDAEREQEEIARQGGTEDDNTTWTGKRLRGPGSNTGVVLGSDRGEEVKIGKYMNGSNGVIGAGVTKARVPVEDEIVEEWDGAVEEPAPKKRKGAAGGFGNFDGW